MNIDAIHDGYVIDHITAGRGMEIYQLLNLDKLDCQVAIIKNAASQKTGRKDIIKIDQAIDINFDVLGYEDPGITVAIIRDGELVEKRSTALPEVLTDVISCKNPRCISSTEQELRQVFRLTDRDARIYRCIYCEAKCETNTIFNPRRK